MAPPPAGRARLACTLLGEGTAVRLEVTGASMTPFLRPHDVVVLEPCRARDLQLGEVVAWEDGGGLTVHRLVGRQGTHLLTRGDGNDFTDPPVEEAQVRGVLRAAERAGRRLRWGLGRERTLIAWASRHGLLFHLQAAWPRRARVR